MAKSCGKMLPPRGTARRDGLPAERDCPPRGTARREGLPAERDVSPFLVTGTVNQVAPNCGNIAAARRAGNKPRRRSSVVTGSSQVRRICPVGSRDARRAGNSGMPRTLQQRDAQKPKKEGSRHSRDPIRHSRDPIPRSKQARATPSGPPPAPARCPRCRSRPW